MKRQDGEVFSEWSARLLEEAVYKAAHELGELVPPESRKHLLQAQQELVLAALTALEHHRHPNSHPSKPHRVRKIDLD